MGDGNCNPDPIASLKLNNSRSHDKPNKANRLIRISRRVRSAALPLDPHIATLPGMANRFESTVADLPAQVTKLGASDTQRVVVTVLDEEEGEKLAELKRLIAQGEASELIDGDTAFAEMRTRLAQKYPHSA